MWSAKGFSAGPICDMTRFSIFQLKYIKKNILKMDNHVLFKTYGFAIWEWLFGMGTIHPQKLNPFLFLLFRILLVGSFTAFNCWYPKLNTFMAMMIWTLIRILKPCQRFSSLHDFTNSEITYLRIYFTNLFYMRYIDVFDWEPSK